MSQSRREERRAESLNPRDRRRRRLNSPSAPEQPFGFVSSWLDEDLEQTIVDASSLQSGDITARRPSGNMRTARSFGRGQSLQPTVENTHSMHRSDQPARLSDPGQAFVETAQSIQRMHQGDQIAGSSSTRPARDRLMVSDHRPTDRILRSSRNNDLGPIVALDQIVSTEHPTVPVIAQQATSAADFWNFDDDDTASDDSYGIAATIRAIRNADAAMPIQDRESILRFELADAMQERIRSKQAKAFPDNPSVLLVCQSNRYRNEAPDSHGDTPQSTVRYLPFVPVSGIGKRYMVKPDHRKRIDASTTAMRQVQWIPNRFPVELFELITQYLSRDDIKSMRLVNKEFELGVSHSLFDTVVVPFNTELYDMIEQERSVVKRDFKGKRRADDPINNFIDLEPGSLKWKNATEDTEDKVYRGHGLEVFEGFGSHIRRFGMSFEIREDALQNPPPKNILDQHESYFGSYDWPSHEYTRFEKLAGLERTADETSQMKLALSHLSKVQHLALSMDSGLGWMNGPDRSLRSLILQRPSQVFGCSHGIVDAQQQERLKLWETLESAYRKSGTLDELKEGHIERANLKDSLFELVPFSGTSYANTELWANVPNDVVNSAVAIGDGSDVPLEGVLFISNKNSDFRDVAATTLHDEEKLDILKKQDIFSPANLTQYQKEWLLEAEWAQRAFLTTYMLGIVDNGSIFNGVSLLNLARVSSRLVPLLSRNDFWDALPKLQEVILGVIPDWRTVERDDAGFIETQDVDPSHAVEKAYNLIQDFIGPRPIRKLHFSWAAGGEHAEGIFARNHHILPAPVNTLAHSTAPLPQDDSLLSLPHVTELTFSNCWFTPLALVNIVKKLRKQSLKKLRLDSVSLTVIPRTAAAVGANANANNNAVAGAPQAPAAAALAGNFAAQYGAQIWQGPPPGVPVQQWAQTSLQNLNALMAQQGIALQQLPQIVTNHPMGMTLQQIIGMLTTLAAGGPGAPPMAQPGVLFQQQQPHNQLQNNAPPAHFLPAHHITQAFAGAAQPAFAPPMLPAAPQPQVNHHAQVAQSSNGPWYEGHRLGSWVKVIDKISPGPRLEMYRPRGEFDPEPERRKKGLMSIEFRSCGYVQLRSASFDQIAVEAPTPYRMSRYFSRRQNVLSSSMLSSSDKYLGTIVQFMSERESDALLLAWGLTMGWRDRKLAEEAEYDGYLPGGTGRFSGMVTEDTPIEEGDIHNRT